MPKKQLQARNKDQSISYAEHDGLSIPALELEKLSKSIGSKDKELFAKICECWIEQTTNEGNHRRAQEQQQQKANIESERMNSRRKFRIAIFLLFFGLVPVIFIMGLAVFLKISDWLIYAALSPFAAILLTAIIRLLLGSAIKSEQNQPLK